MSTYISETKTIIQIALPLMAAFLVQKGMQLIDTIMMGWIGPEALAAGILSTTIAMLTLFFCMGTLSAVGIQIARARGANQHEMIPKILINGVYIVFLLSIPSMVLIWITPYLLFYLGKDQAIVEKCIEFLHAIVWGTPGFLLFFLLREFVAAFSLTRMVMIVVICVLPLTFIANYIFIYGKLGLPALGVVGIGWAGCFLMWLMFLSLFFYCKKESHVKMYFHFNQNLTLDFRLIREMLSVGVPSGLIFILDSGMFAVGTFMMASFGVVVLAAQSIAMQMASAVYAIPFGLSMAVALSVGNAIGAKNLIRAKRIGYIGLMMALIFAAVIGFIFIAFSDVIIRIFLRSSVPNFQQINDVATKLFIIAGIFQAFDMMQAVMLGALRGYKDTFVPFLCCMFCYWGIGVGSAYFLGFYTHYGAIGVWAGLTLGLMSTSVVLLGRFVMKRIPIPIYAGMDAPDK